MAVITLIQVIIEHITQTNTNTNFTSIMMKSIKILIKHIHPITHYQNPISINTEDLVVGHKLS